VLPPTVFDRRILSGFEIEDVIGGTLLRFQHLLVRTSTVDRCVSHHLTMEALPPTYGVGGFARSQTGELKPMIYLCCKNPELPMSALCQKRTFSHLRPMSALPPKADIETQSRHVRFVPKADSCTAAKCQPYSIT
jgi:hypothetical protein